MQVAAKGWRWLVVGAVAGLVWFHAELAVRLPWMALRTSESAPEGWIPVQLAHVAAGAAGALLAAALGAAVAALWRRSRATTLAVGAALVAIAGAALVRVVDRTELTALEVAGHVGLTLGASLVFVLACVAAVRASRRHGAPRVAAAALAVLALLGAWNATWAARLDLARIAEAFPAPQADERRPNVLLITVDTLRADRVGSYGARDGLTPSIDAVAREGVVFEQAFAQSSWTRPSFGSLLTSLYPSQHGGYVVNDPALGGFHADWGDMLYNGPLRQDVTTAAELFRAAGYTTVAVQANWQASASTHFDQGFDVFLYDALFRVPLWDRTLLGTYGSWLPEFLGRRRRLPFYTRPPNADAVHRVVTALFPERAPRPLFLWVNFIDPHSPYLLRDFSRSDEMPVIAERDSWRPETDAALLEAYESEVRYVDLWLGRVLEQLGRAGALDDAILVIASDHGEDFGDHDVEIVHGADRKRTRGRHHGHSLYNELLHVPLILRAPGRVPAGQRVTSTVRLIDVLPTVVELCGIQPDPAVRFEGESLLSAIRGGPSRPSFAERVYYGLEWKALTLGPQKLVVRPAPGGTERYDLQSDPREERPLPGGEPAPLAPELASWVQRMEEAARKASPGAVDAIDSTTEEQLRALGYVH
jgi:arylsulfatase A-like enzyme